MVYRTFLYNTTNLKVPKKHCVFLFSVKNACLNYRQLDLEVDLVGVPHTWYLWAQSFITLLKLIWGEYDIVALNECKKKCVGLHRTWVSKRTVYPWHFFFVVNLTYRKLTLRKINRLRDSNCTFGRIAWWCMASGLFSNSASVLS